MAFGETVKRLRQDRKWNQEELAKRARIPQATISRIERGVNDNPTQDTLTKLALAFEMSVPAFLREAGLEFTRERGDLPALDAFSPEFAALVRRDGPKLTPGQWNLAVRFFEWLAAQGPQEPLAYGGQAPQRREIEQPAEQQESPQGVEHDGPLDKAG